MIWNSILYMTFFDILICGTVLLACYGYYRNRKLIKRIDFQIVIQMLLLGLIIFAIFYIVDLYTMHILPLYAPKDQIIRAMADLHLNWSWIKSALVVLSVSIGIMYFLNHLLPKTISSREYRIFNLEIVDEITRGIGSELKKEDLYRTIIQKIRNAVPCERCIISQLNRETNKTHNIFFESDIKVETLHGDNNFKEWLSREIYESKKLVNIGDIRKIKLPWFQPRCEVGFRSMLWVPILRNDRCVAHLSLSSTKVGAFSRQAENLLCSIAPHLGIAIQNAQLFEKSMKRAERLSMLNEMNMKISKNLNLDEILHNLAMSIEYLIDADHVRIFLQDSFTSLIVLHTSQGIIPSPKTGKLVYNAGEGITGSVFQNGEPIIISDVQKDPRWVFHAKWSNNHDVHAYLVLPIRNGEKIIGVIGCFSLTPGFFDDEDLEILEAITPQVVNAIENSNKHSQVIKQSDRIAAIADMAKIAGATLESGVLFKTIVKEIRNIVSCNRCVIGTFNEVEGRLHYWYVESDVEMGEFENSDALKLPWLQKVYETKNPVRISDFTKFPEERAQFAVDKGIRSVIMVPILHDSCCIAHFSLFSDKIDAFSSEHETLLLSVAEVLGSAIRNSDDYYRTKKQANKFRDELAHVSRVATMGELSGSIAHELNQPLTAILNNANASLRLLSGNTLELGEVREALDDILEDAKRAGDVIHHLRALSKKTEFNRATVDIEETIREIVSLVQGDLTLKNISLVLDFNADSPLVGGDRIQLQQVVMNLIMNGSESTMASGKAKKELTIRTSIDDEDYIQVAICDNGIGIKPEIENNLFSPFFTSKPEGMGLGLTICRTIIETHQGQIWASNNSNKGATIYFSLPREKVEMQNGSEGRRANYLYSR